MGQLLAEEGDKQGAYKAFRKVVALNPPYELAFNARIAQTEVMASGGSKKMLGYTNIESEKGFLFFQKFLKEQGISQGKSKLMNLFHYPDPLSVLALTIE